MTGLIIPNISKIKLNISLIPCIFAKVGEILLFPLRLKSYKG